MNILIANDDGYTCAGVITLARVLSEKHKVFVVAPECEHSGSGHSLSLFRPMCLRRLTSFAEGVEAYALNGTPVDCVRIGLDIVCKDVKVDLVVAGINTVMNLGTDIIYSGTFNAAMEGTVLGYPSIALSTRARDGFYDDVANWFAERIDTLMAPCLERCTLNINFPHNHRERFSELFVSSLGVLKYDDVYELQKCDENGEVYSLYGKPLEFAANSPDCDVVRAFHGEITATPVLMHGECPQAVEELKTLFGEAKL